MIHYLISSAVDHLPWWVVPAILAVALAATVPWWGPVVLPIWARLPLWVKVGLGGLVAGALAYFAGRNTGRKNAEERQKVLDKKASDGRVKVNTKVGKLSATDREKELAKWQRD